MNRQQTHLLEVVNSSGSPDGTAIILPIIKEGLAKLQETALTMRILERGTADKQNPYVTDAGKCPRKAVLSLLNIPETNPPDFDSQLRFVLGHAFEDAIARILEAYQGATYLREERVEITADGTTITGRRDFDAVRVLLDDALFELKSTNSRAMGFLLRRGTPNEDHIHQLNLYLHATGKPLGYLVYLAAGSTKGEPPLHAWIVKYDPGMAEEDVAALVLANKNAKTDMVPPIPNGYTRSAYPCSYCDYKDFCHGDQSAALAASTNLKTMNTQGERND